MSTDDFDDDDRATLVPLTIEQKALINDNIKLAYKLGHLQFNKNPRGNFTREETLQFALHGLIAAARRYRDYSEKNGYSEASIAAGERFSVFARSSIIGAILNAHSKEDHVHPAWRARYKKLLENGHNPVDSTEQPSIEELAQRTGMTEERVLTTIQRVEVKFFFLDHSDDFSENQIVSQQDVESSVVVSSIQAKLVQTMEELPTVEQVIIAMRYYYNMRFEDIAIELGYTTAGVHAKHRSAVASIHSSIMEQAIELRAS